MCATTIHHAVSLGATAVRADELSAENSGAAMRPEEIRAGEARSCGGRFPDEPLPCTGHAGDDGEDPRVCTGSNGPDRRGPPVGDGDGREPRSGSDVADGREPRSGSDVDDGDEDGDGLVRSPGIGERRELLSSAEGDLERRAPLSSADGDLERRAPLSSADGDLERGAPLSSADGDLDRRAPLSSAEGDCELAASPSSVGARNGGERRAASLAEASDGGVGEMRCAGVIRWVGAERARSRSSSVVSLRAPLPCRSSGGVPRRALSSASDDGETRPGDDAPRGTTSDGGVGDKREAGTDARLVGAAANALLSLADARLVGAAANALLSSADAGDDGCAPPSSRPDGCGAARGEGGVFRAGGVTRDGVTRVGASGNAGLGAAAGGVARDGGGCGVERGVGGGAGVGRDGAGGGVDRAPGSDGIDERDGVGLRDPSFAGNGTDGRLGGLPPPPGGDPLSPLTHVLWT